MSKKKPLAVLADPTPVQDATDAPHAGPQAPGSAPEAASMAPVAPEADAGPLDGPHGSMPEPEAPAAPPASQAEASAPAATPATRFYRVTKGGRVYLDGFHEIKVGVVVSTVSHDLAALAAQGIMAEPCDGPDPVPKED
jgi:hypothetical protein